MRKRFLATLLAICLIVSMIPFSAAAEGTTAGTPVQINSDDALATAIDNQADGQVWDFASGKTFEVSTMVNLTANNITLNLNGSTITAAENFTGTDNSAHLVNVLGEGITINGGTLKTTVKNKHVLNVYDANGFVAEDLTLDHRVANKGAPMIVNGCSATIKGTFTTITGENSWYAVNVDNKVGEGQSADSALNFAQNAVVNFQGVVPMGIKVETYRTASDVDIVFDETVEINTFTPNFCTVLNAADAGATVTVKAPSDWKTGTMDGKDVYLAPGNDLIHIGGTYYATFEAAVEAANEEEDETTINVPAGTFPVTEAININQSVTIQGAGADKTILQSSAASEPTTLIQVAGGNVNFTMDGVYVKGLDTNTHNNSTGLVIGSETGPNYSTGEIKITNCKFTDFTKNGITVKGGTATISHNEIVCKGYPGAAGNGIQIDRGATATITENVISGYESQSNTWSATGLLALRGGEITSLTGNTIKNCQVALSRSTVYQDDDTASIPGSLSGNTVTNCDTTISYEMDDETDLATVLTNAEAGTSISLYGDYTLSTDAIVKNGVSLSVANGTEAGLHVGNLTVEEGNILTVAEGAELFVADGTTLTATGTVTNNGSMTNYGTVDGSLTNNGTIVNGGNVTGTVTGNEVEEVEYVKTAEELKEAVLTENAKIVLGADITLTEKLEINKNITIDGNSYTITGVENNRDVYIEVTNGTFTLSDVTLKDFGGKAATASGVAVIKVPGGATDVKVITNNVNFENFCRSAYDIRSGSFEITGGTIDCGSTDGENSKLTKGIVAGLGTDEVTGTVSGVTITNSASNYTEWDSSAIEVYNNADVDVEDCMITNVENGICADTCYGDGDVSVTVSGCTVEASNNALTVNSVKDDETNKAALTVSGGEYSGEVVVNTWDSGFANAEEGKTESSTISITGGTFTNTNDTVGNYLAPGYELGEDGKVVNTTPGGGTPTEPTEAEPFEDVDENDWFYDEVVYVYENGLMQGTSDTAFSPKNEMDRAMLVTTLYRMEGKPSVADVDVPFTDVTEGYYVDAVAWAYANDIVSGYEDNTFQPKEAITREQYVTILHRYAQFKGMDVSSDTDLSAFTDADKVSGWAEEAMIWAVDTELMQGVTETTIAPRKTAQRCQGAALLTRFHQMMA